MTVPWRSAVVIIAGWTCLALLFSPQTYLISQGARVPISWSQAFASNATTFYAWAVLTPLAIWIGRRYPIGRDRLWITVAIHLGAAFVVAGLHLLLVQLIQVVLSGGTRPPRSLASLWVGYGATNILVYGAVTACTQALAYFTRYQERELGMAQARLQALRAQLHPHFLFNTISAIAELIHVDPVRAERTLTQLSDLLRQSVEDDQAHEVALESELEWLRQYLAIYETLLQDRLTVAWDVAPALRPALVPALILQPLVENAIRHGIAPRASGGTLAIRARRAGHHLVLEVQDDGRGTTLPAGASAPTGIGLANVRARLAGLHGADASLSVVPAPGGGVIATVELPWRVDA